MGQFRVKRKGKHVWAYHFQHDGKRYKKEGFATQPEALIAEGEKRKELMAPRQDMPLIRLGDLVDMYSAECRIRFVHNTVRQKGFVFRSLLAYLVEDPPAELLNPNQISNYLKARALETGNTAANRDKKDIKALFNWAIIEEVIDCKNPCQKLKDFPEDQSKPHIPSRADIAKVKMVATRDEREFIDCLYHLLGRRSEIFNLRWTDVNFETRVADLWTRKKGGGLKVMPKPINKEVFGVLQGRWKRRDKSDPRVFWNLRFCDIDKMMPRVCDKAGVRPFGFHALRHRAASELQERGYTIKQIQVLLGHEKQTTTENYLHLISGDLHGVVDALGETYTDLHGEFNEEGE